MPKLTWSEYLQSNREKTVVCPECLGRKSIKIVHNLDAPGACRLCNGDGVITLYRWQIWFVNTPPERAKAI